MTPPAMNTHSRKHRTVHHALETNDDKILIDSEHFFTLANMMDDVLEVFPRLWRTRALTRLKAKTTCGYAIFNKWLNAALKTPKLLLGPLTPACPDLDMSQAHYHTRELVEGAAAQ